MLALMQYPASPAVREKNEVLHHQYNMAITLGGALHFSRARIGWTPSTVAARAPCNKNLMRKREMARGEMFIDSPSQNPEKESLWVVIHYINIEN